MDPTSTSVMEAESPITHPHADEDPQFRRFLNTLQADGKELIDYADDGLSRIAQAHDASHYLLVPKGIMRPDSADQVARIMAAATGAICRSASELVGPACPGRRQLTR